MNIYISRELTLYVSYIYLLLVLFIPSISRTEKSSSSTPSLRNDILIQDAGSEYIYGEKGYEALRDEKYEDAVVYFQKALELNPFNILLRKELGYCFIRLDKTESAIREFEQVLLSEPENYQLSLELGFLHHSLKNRERAKYYFEIATTSSEYRIHKKAMNALDIVDQELMPLIAKYWLEIYNDSAYYDRFDDFISYSITRLGMNFKEFPRLQPYLVSRLTFDTKGLEVTNAGNLIIVNNEASLGIGLRYRHLEKYLWYLYMEEMLGYSFNDDQLEDDFFNDFRAGTYFWHGFGETGVVENPSCKTIYPMKPFSEWYGEITYYERFDDDVLFILQLKTGIKIVQFNEKPLDLYGRINLVADTQKYYYNNLGELGMGLRFRPVRHSGLEFYIEHLWGNYFNTSDSINNPYGDHYEDTRIGFNFYRNWFWGRR